MDNREIVDILNELLVLEVESHVHRLREGRHYVSPQAARKAPALRKMLAEETDHAQWIVDEIYRLDGVPVSPSPGIRTAATHYVDAQVLLPRILADEQRLLEAYQRAASVVPADTPTGRLLSLIAGRHRDHVRVLSDGQRGNATASAGAPDGASERDEKADDPPADAPSSEQPESGADKSASGKPEGARKGAKEDADKPQPDGSDGADDSKQAAS